MFRRFCAIGTSIAPCMRQSEGEPEEHHFYINGGLTGGENPLFFAPEVVHLKKQRQINFLEVSSAAGGQSWCKNTSSERRQLFE
jgi:hypothetical protein